MSVRLIMMLNLLEETKKSDDRKKSRQAREMRKMETISRDSDFIHIYRLSEDLINILESDLTPFMPAQVRASALTNRLKVGTMCSKKQLFIYLDVSY